MSNPTHALGSMRSVLRGSSNQGHRMVFSSGGSERSETCADLKNKETHFAVKVNIGTPLPGAAPQTFELVADTGSDSVVVTSCMCLEKGLCKFEQGQSNCFAGTNHSESFELMQVGQRGRHEPFGRAPIEPTPLGIRMTFGSGSVTSVIASDFVEVGGVRSKLDNGVLLMVDRTELRLDGPFDGILGLGPPKAEMAHLAKHRVPDYLSRQTQGPAKDSQYTPKLFLQEAGVERFSMCFNDGDDPGALRLNVPEFQNPMPAIGSFHWGLGLYGMHIGGNYREATICLSHEMKAGQESPCGAIPDSGTQLLMGPQDQIVKVFETLCDNWSRCVDEHNTVGKNMSKAEVFQTLLYKCDDWLTEKDGIGEVPSIHLTLGVPGNLQRIELTSWSFIVESSQEMYKHHTKYLFGKMPVDVPTPSGLFQKVCVPSFGVHNYNTVENGPVWILGAPIFYQYNVGYGLQGNGTIDFGHKDKCRTCNETKASFLSTKSEMNPASQKRARPMRVAKAPPRVPNRDTSLPL